MFQASVCLWDGQAGAAGLSGARQSRKGTNSTEKFALHSSYSQTWLHVFDGVFVFCVFFNSLGRCVQSLPAPTPSNKGRTNTSRCWWTGRRTYCGALSWRGEQETHKLKPFHEHFTQTFKCSHYLLLPMFCGLRYFTSPPTWRRCWLNFYFWVNCSSKIIWWWCGLTSISCDSNGGCVSLQDLRLPCPLHRRVQHGSWCQTEAPGPVLERPRHQAPVRTTQRLLRLWIDSTGSPAHGRQNTSISILILAPTNKPHFVKSWTVFFFQPNSRKFL